MIPSGDTWGISGPTFLLAYLVLAVAVGVAVAPCPARPRRRVRRAAREPDGGAPVRRGVPQRRTRELARHRGAERDVPGRDDQHRWSGASSSPRHGRTPGRTSSSARSTTPPATGGVAPRPGRGRGGRIRAAPHRAAAGRRRPAPGRGAPPADPPGGRVGARGGRVRCRPGHGRAREQPSGRLPDHPGRAGHSFSACCSLGTAPRRTRAGDAAAAAAGDRAPLAVAVGASRLGDPRPAGAALAVGVFGVGALWAADPAFATELAAQRAASGRPGSRPAVTRAADAAPAAAAGVGAAAVGAAAAAA